MRHKTGPASQVFEIAQQLVIGPVSSWPVLQGSDFVEDGSLDRVAKLFGVPLSQLAGWLGRSKQAVSKTPDADSLQDALGYFERVARLRLLLKDDGEFRKWLRTPHPDVVGKNPLELLARNEGQALADFVDDILSGTPG